MNIHIDNITAEHYNIKENSMCLTKYTNCYQAHHRYVCCCYNSACVISACVHTHQVCSYSTCLVAFVCYFSTPLFALQCCVHAIDLIVAEAVWWLADLLSEPFCPVTVCTVHASCRRVQTPSSTTTEQLWRTTTIYTSQSMACQPLMLFMWQPLAWMHLWTSLGMRDLTWRGSSSVTSTGRPFMRTFWGRQRAKWPFMELQWAPKELAHACEGRWCVMQMYFTSPLSRAPCLSTHQANQTLPKSAQLCNSTGCSPQGSSCG